MVQQKGLQLIAATFSPMHSDGSVNCDPIEDYMNYLLRSGISTVFINGSTGESLSLTVEERRQLAEAWMRVASGRTNVMIHVGHNAIHEAIELAGHANEIGADAVSAMAPSFFRPHNVDELVDFLSPIAAAAQETPFYFYHMPMLTGVQVAMDEFLRKASDRIPNLAGVKYTHGDLVEYGQCQTNWSHRYQLLFGCDDLLLPAMLLGAEGAIGTSYNFIPKTFARLVQSYAQQDMPAARELSFITGEFVRCIHKYGLLSYGKKLMAQFGVDCGAVRLPLKAASEDLFDHLLESLSRLTLLDNLRPVDVVSGMHYQADLQSESSSQG